MGYDRGMIYLARGTAALFILLWLTSGRRNLIKRPEWRIGAAVFSAAAFAAAGYMGMRGVWSGALVMIVLGLWLATSARYPRKPAAKAAPSQDISLSEAYEILDLRPGATREEVQAAYTRLMKLVHPDRGGGAGLAARLNAARDRLLKN